MDEIAVDRTDVTQMAGTSNVETWILNAVDLYTIRNNGGTPCILEAYWIMPKKSYATTSTVLTKFREGVKVKGGTEANVLTDPRYNLRDGGTYFNKFFKIFKYRQYLLNAGDQIIVRLNRRKPFLYDETGAGESLTKSYGQAIVFRLNGVVSHDETTTTAVGTCDCTFDYTIARHMKFNVEPDQGFKHFIEATTALDEQTAPLVDADTHIETKENL